MLPPREPTVFETLPTEDVAEVTALLRVHEDKMRGDTVITPGTTLADFMPGVDKGDALRRGFGSYILTRPGPKESGWHSFYFAKPKTDAEKEVPFRTTVRTRNLPWDAVLLDLQGGNSSRVETQDSGVGDTGGSTSNTRTRTEFENRYRLIPGINYPTEVIEEEFQSATPWDQLEATRPVPTQVRIFYKGAQLSIDCLHEDVIVPPDEDDFQREDGYGNPSAAELPPGQFMPATVPTRWTIYVVDDDQDFRNGLYYRKRVTVNQLPPVPRALRL
jgi:hypothetical protein